MHEKGQYDVAIIGGGPGGMSAAIWCAELGLRCVLIDERAELGCQLLKVYNRIENFPGRSAANGSDLRDHFIESMKGKKIEMRLDSHVVLADLASKRIELQSGEVLTPQAVIIATGVRRRMLGVPGEEEFAGHGILTSGAKEAETVKGKKVLVVGGGDAALENALMLATHAESVTIMHRGDSFSARTQFIEEMKVHQNIAVMFGVEVSGFFGAGSLERVELIDRATNKASEIAIDAALIRIGFAPNSELFLEQIATDANGYVIVDHYCNTNLEGVYGVGDVCRPSSQTIAGAVGDGATAAKTLAMFDSVTRLVES